MSIIVPSYNYSNTAYIIHNSMLELYEYVILFLINNIYIYQVLKLYNNNLNEILYNLYIQILSPIMSFQFMFTCSTIT